MNEHINELFQAAMKPIMQYEAKKFNGAFLSQEEFEKNQGRIMIITNATRQLEKQLATNGGVK